MKRRVLSLLLCLCMALSLLSVTVFAEGSEEPAQVPVCTCETACAEGAVNVNCPVCGAEGAQPADCALYEPKKPAEAEGLTAAQKVQAQINALPEASTITAENRADVEKQLSAIDNAKLSLTSDELDTLDFTKYNAAVAVLNVLDGQPGAEKPDGMVGYMVTLDANGGKVGNESSVQFPITQEGTSFQLPTPIRDGYNFTGWYTAMDGGDKVDDNNIASYPNAGTLYAHWVKAYTITFDLKGGTLPEGTKNPATTNAQGKLDSLPIPARDGYTFHFWHTGDRTTGEVTTESVFTEDTTVYAWFGKTIDTVNISLSGYGNGLPVSGLKLTWDESDVSMDYYISSDASGKNKVEASDTFTREGTYYLYTTITLAEDIDTITKYTLNGASTNPASTQDGQKVTAVFELPTVGYTVTLDPNGGTVSPSTGTTNAEGKLTSLPTPTRDGCTFDGWYTTKQSGPQVTTDFKFTENTTLYAHWKVDAKFSLSGYGYEKVIPNIQVTSGTEEVVFPVKPEYGVDVGIVAFEISDNYLSDIVNKTTLSSGKFKTGLCYFLWVEFQMEEGYGLGTATLDGQEAWAQTVEGNNATVVFRLPLIYTIQVNCGKNGSVTYGDTTYKGAQTFTVGVLEGENATFTITPNKGYSRSKLWIDDQQQTKTVKEYTFKDIASGHSLKVTFAKNSNNPKTGDNNDIALWLALLVVSGGAAVGTAVYGKKRKYSGK